MPLLAALCAGAILTAYALSWRLAGSRFETTFVLFVVGLTGAVGGWSMRPQVITSLCFMLACTLVARDRVWWLPMLFFVWANCHGGVGLGIIALGAMLVAEAIAARRIPVRLSIASALSVAVTLATPMGIGLWQLLAWYGQREKTRGILEWMAPTVSLDYFAFWLLAALLIGGVLFRYKHLDVVTRRLSAIALASLILALSASRNVTAFLLIAVPVVARLISRQAAPRAAARDRTLVNTVIAGAAGIGAATLVLFMWSRPPARLNWSPMTPEAIRAVSACPAPIYNSLGIGGLLIRFVRDQPVFIDNRNNPYPSALLDANLRLEQGPGHQELFAQHQFRCAVIETGSFTDRSLRQDDAWGVAYEDASLSVHARKGP